MSPFKDFGLFAGLVYVLDRLLARMSPAWRAFLYELMVQPIPDEPLVKAANTRALTIRELKRGDPEIALMPARPDIKEARFDHEAICLGAFRGDQLVGHIWFRFGAYEEDEVRCTYAVEPQGESVFDFDLYIFPEYRMGRAFVQLWDEAGKFLRRRGIRYTYSRITRFNLASRRAHRHFRATRVGTAMFLVAGPVQLMIATVSPYVHVTLDRGRRARLVLRPDALLSAGRRASTEASRPPAPVSGTPPRAGHFGTPRH